jgi:sugar-specific transcriptional regulator TrmB
MSEGINTSLSDCIIEQEREIQQLKENKKDAINKIKYALNNCEPKYGGKNCTKETKEIYKMALEYCLDILKGANNYEQFKRTKSTGSKRID